MYLLGIRMEIYGIVFVFIIYFCIICVNKKYLFLNFGFLRLVDSDYGFLWFFGINYGEDWGFISKVG